MEEMTVVYFCVDKESYGRKGWCRQWQYRMEEKEVLYKTCTVKRITVCLPARYRKKVCWSSALLEEYIGNLQLPCEGREVYYLFTKEAGMLLHRSMEPLSFLWILLLIQNLDVGFDNLVILHTREMETERLVQEFAGDTKHIEILTENPEDFETFQETILDEYGFWVEVKNEARKLQLLQNGKTLFIAGSNLYGMTPARLGNDCIWLSVETECETGKRMCARVKQGRYVDIRDFSDLTL